MKLISIFSVRPTEELFVIERVARHAAKLRAKEEIERVWPDWRQRNIALGLVTNDDKEACIAHIQAQVAKENAISAAIDAIMASDKSEQEKRQDLFNLEWPT